MFIIQEILIIAEIISDAPQILDNKNVSLITLDKLLDARETSGQGGRTLEEGYF